MSEKDGSTSSSLRASKEKSSEQLQLIKRERLRHNKLYKTPPTPSLDEKISLERSFTLDCIALKNISLDYIKVNPQLGTAIPPYNSTRDRNVSNYFNNTGVDKLRKKTGQVTIFTT